MKYINLWAYLTHFFKLFKNNRVFAFLVVGYTFSCVALFLYSFTQIDLNLTLVSYPFIHAIQKPFIYLGYYQRTLSASIFLVLLVSFFALFITTLRSIERNKIGKEEVVMLIVVITGILFFSYPALSHDIFNYMFDAKIFTEYGDNPYLMRALDYPEDPWVRFMHWTHRTYPYGPVFLPISIVLSYIGMNIFPLTLVLFKSLMIFSYLGTSFFIYKILEKVSPKYSLSGTAFFALNPLVIFETIVSSHHDMVMMFLAVFALYLFLLKKRILSFIVFLLSVGIKYVTVFMSPLYVLGFHPLLLLSGAVAATTAVILKLGLQPWYLLWVLPFTALLSKYRSVRIVTIVISFVFMLRYLPFLAFGEWPAEVLALHNWTVIGSLLLTIILYGAWKFIIKTKQHA